LSGNPFFSTWGSPQAITPTAKRMNLATAWCNQYSGDNSTLLGTAMDLAEGASSRDNTWFGVWGSLNPWRCLDNKVEFRCDCDGGRTIVNCMLWLLGVPPTNCDPWYDGYPPWGGNILIGDTNWNWRHRCWWHAYPSTDENGDPPHYNSVCSGPESENGMQLEFTLTYGHINDWSVLESLFSIRDGGEWYYMSVHPLSPAFSGTGSDQVTKKKSALYRVMAHYRDRYWPNYQQAWCPDDTGRGCSGGLYTDNLP